MKEYLENELVRLGFTVSLVFTELCVRKRKE